MFNDQRGKLYVLSQERDREQTTGVPDGAKIVGGAMIRLVTRTFR